MPVCKRGHTGWCCYDIA